MRFRDDMLLEYVSHAPLALAFERYLECRIYRGLPFDRPILDLGCGDGLFAKVLFAEKIDTGIDPDPSEIKRAHKSGAYAELIPCGGDSVPKPDGYFATTYSNSVLEHIFDLQPVLREVRRLLKPGGRFYMTVPSVQFEHYTMINQRLTALGLERWAARYRKFCSAVIWRQSQYYTLEGWKDILRGSGFEVVQAYEYDPRRICLLNDLLYPFGVFGAISKRFLGRWTLFPVVRKWLLRPFCRLAEGFLKGGERAEEGGLVFLDLRKAEQA